MILSWLQLCSAIIEFKVRKVFVNALKMRTNPDLWGLPSLHQIPLMKGQQSRNVRICSYRFMTAIRVAAP